jgi:hypothetical protein
MPRWNTAAVRSRTLARLRDERGIALVMAIGILFVLTISLTTVIYVTSASARHAERSNAGQKAHALAEAGIHDAFAVLNANYPNDPAVTGQPWPGNWCLLHPQPIAPEANAVITSFPGNFIPGATADTPCGGAPFTGAPDAGRPNETVTWWGRLRAVNDMGLAWVIRSTGSVPNPTGPGASAVTRTLTVKVPVIRPTGQVVPPGILDWVYSGGDMTFDQKTNIESPLFIDGNLMLRNQGEVRGPLHVMGNLTLDNPQVEIKPTAKVAVGGMTTVSKGKFGANGTGKRVSEAHLAGGCAGKATCGWDADNIFVEPTKRDQFMPPVPPAVEALRANPTNWINWSYWYQGASPGPMWNCDTPTGDPPIFDEDGVMNNNAPTFDLTGKDYTCRTLAGELSWKTSTKKLTVKGTIFIDGSASASNKDATYEGEGTIYLSGTYVHDTNARLCAVRCETSDGWDPSGGWDPDKPETSLLVIVANGGVPGGTSIEVKSAAFQGALIGTNGVTVLTQSNVVGPMVSVTGSVSPGQGGTFLFPKINFAPTGTPGNPPPPSIVLEPREFEGG